ALSAFIDFHSVELKTWRKNATHFPDPCDQLFASGFTFHNEVFFVLDPNVDFVVRFELELIDDCGGEADASSRSSTAGPKPRPRKTPPVSMGDGGVFCV
ncbi:MAG TPA: hypothetical protein VHC90_20570, partial [Bryobacteraceae bacterium]|nr:hypothetical protein [Bryobacteraceae bacterium]